jgi:hypothetical protein
MVVLSQTLRRYVLILPHYFYFSKTPWGLTRTYAYLNSFSLLFLYGATTCSLQNDKEAVAQRRQSVRSR